MIERTYSKPLFIFETALSAGMARLYIDQNLRDEECAEQGSGMWEGKVSTAFIIESWDDPESLIERFGMLLFAEDAVLHVSTEVTAAGNRPASLYEQAPCGTWSGPKPIGYWRESGNLAPRAVIAATGWTQRADGKIYMVV